MLAVIVKNPIERKPMMTPRKAAQVDTNQIIDGSFVRTLEDNGYLAEARKKIGR